MSSHEQKTAVAVSKPKTPRAKAEAAPVTETQALIYALAKASRDPKVDIVKMDWLRRRAWRFWPTRPSKPLTRP